jgi:hypothetical protein
MDRRKAGYILLLMLALPSLALPATASTGNPISNFANNLLLIVPPVLFIMSILALRKADYDYAFTLFLASIIVTVALSAFQTQVSSQGLLFFNMGVTLSGPTSTTVNSNVQYNVIYKAFPSGFQTNEIVPSNYTWVIYYNSTILVFNSQTGYIDGNYITLNYITPTSIGFTPKQVGTYTVSYTAEFYGTMDNFPAVVIGTGGTVLQVNPPLSGWNWFTNAVISAIESFVNTAIGAFLSASSFIASLIAPELTFVFQSPTIDSPWGNLVKYTYNEILETSVSLSLLLIAGTVAYNALRNNYTDLIDVASDLLYKLGVWMLFTFGGLEIYNYVALFINGLINEIMYPVLPQLGVELAVASAFWIAVLIAPDAIPFFGGAIKVTSGGLAEFFLISGAIIIVRYFMILAIVALIPLLATLWIFEWTRKIADALVDILIGLIMAGLINAILFSFFVAIGAGIALFLLPLVLDTSTIASVLLSIFTIKPHEHVPKGLGKGSGSGGQSPPNQNPQNPPALPSSPQNIGYQNKPSGSPTTYI